jgi:tRNA pseudouridine38-40 synthase
MQTDETCESHLLISIHKCFATEKSGFKKLELRKETYPTVHTQSAVPGFQQLAESTAQYIEQRQRLLLTVVWEKNCFPLRNLTSHANRRAGRKTPAREMIWMNPNCRRTRTIIMRNLKLILSYDGCEFAGWQVQPDTITVQGTLASAIGRITGEKVLPQASGRTDAGVHALAQVVSFVTESAVPTANFVKALNDILPVSVRVLEVEEAAPDFHARKSARAKTYRYRVYREAICPPFLARYVWHYPYPLDEDAMSSAAERVRGEHDFTSFAAVDPEREKEGVPALNVRTIFSSAWKRQGDEFIYTVRGSGFLHHMVRNLVGTFILVGKGTLQPEDLTRILEAHNRSAAGATAPPNGLYLVNVEY